VGGSSEGLEKCFTSRVVGPRVLGRTIFFIQTITRACDCDGREEAEAEERPPEWEIVVRLHIGRSVIGT